MSILREIVAALATAICSILCVAGYGRSLHSLARAGERLRHAERMPATPDMAALSLRRLSCFVCWSRYFTTFDTATAAC